MYKSYQEKMAVPLLVPCEWLKEKISSGDLGNIVILDVSWASSKDCEEEYKKLHIPGTRYMNVFKAEHTDIYPRNIPTQETFTDLAQSAGVNSDSHVIVYSNSTSVDKAGYFISGRGWWSFRYFGHKNVSVLDGGLPKWLQLGFPTTDTPTDIKRGNFMASIEKCVHKSFDEVKENTKSGKFQVLDTRAPTAYAENHIEGAKNLLMAEIVDSDQCVLKSKEELKKLFSNAGVDLSKPLVTHCSSGMSSCAVAFAAVYAGAETVSVFHGGFTEWTKRQEAK